MTRRMAPRLVLLLLGLAACNRTPETTPDTGRVPASSPATAAPSPSPAAADAPAGAEADAGGFRIESKARLVAIGDVHGDLRALRAALRLAGAVDGDDRWIGKDLTVVQTGDQIDRGDQDREVLDVLEKLQGEAQAAGGSLVVLNGNHELMNAVLDFRYVTPRSFASFADFASRAPAFAERLPERERGRAAAFAPGAPYALKLAKRPTVAVVGDSLFAHGGVLPEHVDYGLSRINSQASAFLSGKLATLPKILSGEDSPIWSRVYGEPEVGDAACAALGRTLQQVGAKRLVVGHTVQKNGISSACGERVFRIDVGLSAYYGDHEPQVLEISGGQARVVKAGAAASATKGAPRDSAVHSAP